MLRLHSLIQNSVIRYHIVCFRSSVAIVVPYRDRDDQLERFVKFLHNFLQEQQLKYTIYIVEQVGNKHTSRLKTFIARTKCCCNQQYGWL